MDMNVYSLQSVTFHTVPVPLNRFRLFDLCCWRMKWCLQVMCGLALLPLSDCFIRLRDKKRVRIPEAAAGQARWLGECAILHQQVFAAFSFKISQVVGSDRPDLPDLGPFPQHWQ